jgi:hypothetical protein
MGYALIPQIYQNFRHKKSLMNIQTSFLTTLAVLTVAVMFFTINLLLSALVTLIIGFLWLTILLQGIFYR